VGGHKNITFGILNDQAKPMVFTFELNERWRAFLGWDPLRVCLGGWRVSEYKMRSDSWTFKGCTHS